VTKLNSLEWTGLKRTGLKRTGLWLPILIWVALLAVVIGVLHLLTVGSTMQGGILGAFCGATIVVVLAVRERAAARDRPPVHERYRR